MTRIDRIIPNKWHLSGFNRLPYPSPRSGAYTFETKKAESLRTAGIVLHKFKACVSDFSQEEAAAYANVALARKDAAARGKVAVLGYSGLRVFQANAWGELLPALCGNATAAAILSLKTSAGRLQVEGPGAVRVTADFLRSGSTIHQSWLIPGMTVTEFTWRGRYCVRVLGLNSYTVITGGLPVGMEPETCRVQLADGQPNAKLAVFGNGAAQNHVAFFNASGRHGAAPMTGLASLAVAAHALPQFAARIKAPDITFQTACDCETYTLSPVSRAGDGRLRIALPDVEAFVSPLREVTQ